MIILSLVTIGFAKLMQREQRQANDRSLSTQAFYSAESGVNDVVNYMKDKTKPPLTQKTTCDVSSNPANTSPFKNGAVNSAIGSTYTCLLINPEPPSLEYTQGAVSTETSTVVPIKSTTGAKIAHVEVYWDDPLLPGTISGGAGTPVYNCPATPVVFPVNSGSGAWPVGRPGMLRVDLVRTDAGNLTRAKLISNQITLFLYPTACGGTGTNSIAYSNSIASNGQVVLVKCSAVNSDALPHDCKLSIDFGLAADQSSEYSLRVKSIYRKSDMTVRIKSASGDGLKFKDAQVLIDSTGKATDVVRRIQVRVPINPPGNVPEDPLRAMGPVCKLLQVYPAVGATPGAANSFCPL